MPAEAFTSRGSGTRPRFFAGISEDCANASWLVNSPVSNRPRGRGATKQAKVIRESAELKKDVERPGRLIAAELSRPKLNQELIWLALR